MNYNAYWQAGKDAVKNTAAKAAASAKSAASAGAGRITQIRQEAAELVKWKNELLSKTGTQFDPEFVAHLDNQISKLDDEIETFDQEKAKVDNLFKGKPTVSGQVDIKQQAKDAGKKLLEIAKSVPDMFVKVFEPANIVENKLGGEAYTTVIKGIHSPESRLMEFNETRLNTFDSTFGDLGQWFSKFSETDLKNFMITQGKPIFDGAKELQKQASVDITEALKEPDLVSAIQEIRDHNYKLLNEVADGDITKVKDYFYGVYDNAWECQDSFAHFFIVLSKVMVFHCLQPPVVAKFYRSITVSYRSGRRPNENGHSKKLVGVWPQQTERDETFIMPLSPDLMIAPVLIHIIVPYSYTA